MSAFRLNSVGVYQRRATIDSHFQVWLAEESAESVEETAQHAVLLVLATAQVSISLWAMVERGNGSWTVKLQSKFWSDRPQSLTPYSMVKVKFLLEFSAASEKDFLRSFFEDSGSFVEDFVQD